MSPVAHTAHSPSSEGLISEQNRNDRHVIANAGSSMVALPGDGQGVGCLPPGLCQPAPARHDLTTITGQEDARHDYRTWDDFDGDAA